MAPPAGGLKGFYRQRKRKVAAKPSQNKKKSKNDAKSSEQCCSGGSSGSAAEDEAEDELRRFDMDSAYGPCIGVTRLRRWERATAMGLRPPPHLRDLILSLHDGASSSLPPPPSCSTKKQGGNGDVVSHQLDQCLWAGKV